MYRDILRAQLKVDEGVRLSPYTDTVGKLTIGVGHNLDDKPLPMPVVDLLLEHDIDDAEADAKRLIPAFDALSDARKAVVVNMAFNIGYDRLAGFRGMLRAIASADFETAAVEMLDSKWAAQVGARAQRLAEAMRKG